MSRYIFPAELQTKGHPALQFSCAGSDAIGAFTVYLPVPQNISHTDAATYNDSELGVFAGSAVQIARDIQNNAGFDIKKYLPQGITGLAAGLLQGSNAIPEAVKSAASVATGTTLNKNINTEFTQSNTRRHTFQFKLLPTSLAESNTISNMLRDIRLGVYPTGNNIQLKYPPKWKINYINASSAFPKYYESYLENFEITYNSEANLFFKDGSPRSVDFTMIFIEIKALTGIDIKGLT